MAISDLSSFTSKQGVTTAVWRYDEADTYVVQHDFMHLSFFQDDLDSLKTKYELAKAGEPIE